MLSIKTAKWNRRFLLANLSYSCPGGNQVNIRQFLGERPMK